MNIDYCSTTLKIVLTLVSSIVNWKNLCQHNLGRVTPYVLLITRYFLQGAFG